MGDKRTKTKGLWKTEAVPELRNPDVSGLLASLSAWPSMKEERGASLTEPGHGSPMAKVEKELEM